jgi:lysophospholipase L1-like esterase
VLLTAAPTGTDGATAPVGSTLVAKAQKHRFNVAFMGDSITDYKSHGGQFIRYLEQRCPESRFDNYAKGGEMVNQMRRRFAALFPSTKEPYSHVVIFGGVNDLYSDLTAHRTNERIQADLLAMYTTAREAGAEVIALTVSPWGGFRKYFNARRGKSTLALNEWIQSQSGTTVAHVVDTHPLLRCGHPDELCPEYGKPFRDGLHVGKEGHRIIGQALYETVFMNCR